MSISDVMSEGVKKVLRYLEDDSMYANSRKEIAVAVVAMERLRLTPGFDIVPAEYGGKAPELPTTPEGCLAYLDALLEKERSTLQ